VKDLESNQVEDELDDLITTLSAEAYFNHRTVPELDRLRAQAPYLAMRIQIYDALILFTSLASTVLGALKYKEWIPVTVAVVSFLTTYMQYEGLHTRIGAANTAIGELNALVATWHSLSVVEKRTPSVKNLIVMTTESAILREVRAETSGASSQSSSMGSTDSADGEDHDADNDADKKDGNKK
jgi:hypothetical protein